MHDCARGDELHTKRLLMGVRQVSRLASPMRMGLHCRARIVDAKCVWFSLTIRDPR
jgi:hypothetical protein